MTPGGSTVVVSAVVIRDGVGRVLTVRKRGTEAFMLPGGKPEPGETPPQTAAREVREEVEVEVAADRLRPLGRFRAAAANEADTDVVADVFEAPRVAVGRPSAEIAELRWVPLDTPLAELAPLTRLILPLLDDPAARPPAP